MSIIIIILLCTSCLLADAGWNWQNPRPQGNDLEDIHIFDQNSAIAVGEMGTVMRTTNGGVDWQVTNNAGGSLDRLHAVFFITESVGWAAGAKGTILRTDNGGVTWHKQNSPTEIDLFDIYFIDNQNGWCVGRWGKLLKTIDGGVTWEAVISSTQRLLRSIVFITREKGWIVGHGGVVLKTENGGASWKYQALDKSANLRALDVRDENNIWLSGEDGFIYNTSDGGQTWQKKATDISADFSAVHFFDANNGMICGYGTVYNEGIKYSGAGMIITTGDGGLTWHTQIGDTINPLNRVSVSPAGFGWAVGSRGTIIKIEQMGAKVALQSKSVSGLCYAIDFADKNNGWIVGYQSILHTADGGDNWEQQQAEGISELLNVHVFDANTAIIVGGELISAGNTFEIHSQVLKTEDAGKTWRYIRNQNMEYAFDIEFVDANTAYLVGYPNLIAKTTDGGQTWQVQTGQSDNLFWAVSFVDASTGWAVGNNGRIFNTTDGGANWKSQRSRTSAYLYDVEFLTNQKGWCVGEGGTILTTEDGGENWTAVKSPKIATLNSICFADDRHARIVGSRGVLLRTDNSGASWYDLPSGTQEDLSCIFFIDDQTGWITSYEGSILKTTSGGIDRIESPLSGGGLQPSQFVLNQNYPNPFNNATIIDYQLSKTSQVELSVYNLLGQRVATLVSARQPAGQYQVQWDAGNLSSGIYLCQLIAGKHQVTRRLVLLK